MQEAAGDAAKFESESQNETHRSVISGVVSLIEQVQARLRLIEQQIAREILPASQESGANVIVLDDVSPRYVMASSALKACDTNLGIALNSLRDSAPPRHGARANAEHPPALS
jgi:hypothetical protein